MRVTWVPLALARAGVSASRTGEPGWLSERACVPGPGFAAVPPESSAAPGSAGPSGHWLSPDTLRPPGGLGSPRRLRVFRAGLPLLVEQDFRLPAGDSLIVFAAPVPPGDSVCWDKAYTPLLPQPLPPLYRLESVPVYRRGLQDTSL